MCAACVSRTAEPSTEPITRVEKQVGNHVVELDALHVGRIGSFAPHETAADLRGPLFDIVARAARPPRFPLVAPLADVGR
jgi:hypothetical protein